MSIKRLIPYSIKAGAYKKYMALRQWVIERWFPKIVVEERYHRIFGKNIDWEHPVTLNEKINWLKFHADLTLWTHCADKYRVREFVKERGLGNILVPLYGVYKKVDEIDFDNLPDSFVLKPNNGSGDSIIVRDKTKLDVDDAKKRLAKSLRNKHFASFTYEPHYNKIKPLIIAEELLNEEGCEISLTDYKIWCFNGKPYTVTVIQNRQGYTYDISQFDLQWEQLNVIVYTDAHRMPIDIPQKPEKWIEMLNIASILSKGFKQVRVDLYYTKGKIYFGELTFTSNGGFSTWYTNDFETELGNQINLR